MSKNIRNEIILIELEPEAELGLEYVEIREAEEAKDQSEVETEAHLDGIILRYSEVEDEELEGETHILRYGELGDDGEEEEPEIAITRHCNYEEDIKEWADIVFVDGVRQPPKHMI